MKQPQSLLRTVGSISSATSLSRDEVDRAVAVGIDHGEAFGGLLHGRLGGDCLHQSRELVEIDEPVLIAVEEVEVTPDLLDVFL